MNKMKSKLSLFVILALCVVLGIWTFSRTSNGKRKNCERLINHYFTDKFTHFDNASVTFLALKYFMSLSDSEIRQRIKARSNLYDFAVQDKEILRAVGFRNTLKVIGGALFLTEKREGEIPDSNAAHRLEILAIYCLAYDMAIWLPAYFKPYLEDAEWQQLFGSHDYDEEINRLAKNIMRSFEKVNSGVRLDSDLPSATFLEIYGAGRYGK